MLQGLKSSSKQNNYKDNFWTFMKKMGETAKRINNSASRSQEKCLMQPSTVEN